MSAPDGLRKKIGNWLLQEGWTLEAQAPPDPKIDWVVLATDDRSRRLLIYQHVGHTDRLTVQGTLRISEAHRAAFAEMSAEEVESLLWQLRLELLRAGLDYDGLVQPLDEIRVVDVGFVEGVRLLGLSGFPTGSIEGLSKGEFFRRLHLVRRGTNLVQFLIQQRLG